MVFEDIKLAEHILRDFDFLKLHKSPTKLEEIKVYAEKHRMELNRRWGMCECSLWKPCEYCNKRKNLIKELDRVSSHIVQEKKQ